MTCFTYIIFTDSWACGIYLFRGVVRKSYVTGSVATDLSIDSKYQVIKKLKFIVHCTDVVRNHQVHMLVPFSSESNIIFF